MRASDASIAEPLTLGIVSTDTWNVFRITIALL